MNATSFSAAADHLEHAARKGAGQVPLGNGAAQGVVGKGQNVLVKVDGHAVFGHQAVDALDHPAVARVALFAVGSEAVVQLHGAVVRYAVHGHVGHAVLIGIVDAAIGEGRVFKAGAAFHADGGRHAGNGRGLQEFLRSGDGIMIHQTAGAKPRLTGKIHRSRGGVGGEGIGGVYMVFTSSAGGGQNFFLEELLQVHQRALTVQQGEQLIRVFVIFGTPFHRGPSRSLTPLLYHVTPNNSSDTSRISVFV